MSCVGEKRLAEFVAGALAPEDAAAVREHFKQCQPCQAAHARMAEMTARLGSAPGEFDAPDLAGDVMRLIRHGRSEPSRSVRHEPRRWFWPWLWAPAAAMAAAALLLVAWPRAGTDVTPGFQARGETAISPDRWVSIEVFRGTKTGYRPVGERIAADDALAFAYSNPTDHGFRYLMIVAVDDGGRVFWYYPVREGEHDNPRSLSIGKTVRAELQEEIRHDLTPGRVRIFGLFSKNPLEVASTEAIVTRAVRAAGGVQRLSRIDMPEVGQQSFLFVVDPPQRGARR